MDMLLSGYQQKIGTYDKQLWETRIEQKEQRIYGLNHVQMRTAKLNTDLIDLDLVRGSSFAKAKPQHGFFKVTKLATLRSFFLPFYTTWWMRQMSLQFFTFILILYIIQIVNIIIFYCYSQESSHGSSEGISCMELVVPIIMGWFLSLIHSQIVATMPDKQQSRKRTRKRLQFAEDDANGNKANRKLNIKPLPKTSAEDDDSFERSYGNDFRSSEEEVLVKESSRQSIKVISSTPLDNKLEEEPPITLSSGPEKVANPESACSQCKRGSQDESSNCTSCLKCSDWVKKLGENMVNNTTAICSDSESEPEEVYTHFKKQTITKRRTSLQEVPRITLNSVIDSNCDTENEAFSAPRDWTNGITSNSEDCSSDLDDVSDGAPADRFSDSFITDGEANAFLSPPSVKASCTIYERDEIKKADLSMLDISSIIISKVEATPFTADYFYAGIVVAALLALLSPLCRLAENGVDAKLIWEACRNGSHSIFIMEAPFKIGLSELSEKIGQLTQVALGTSALERYIVTIAMVQRLILASMVFFLLAVAERTFKQRLLYAKLFSRLTSSRRARKSEIPHFRLNKVRNIKTWLSVRSYLKKRGPQRSVEVIVSAAFIVTLLLLAFLCAELLKDTVSFSQYYLEALVWCLGLGVMLLRFITLGTKINKKYRNLSVLITEQINLHLQIEQKPHKKDELTVANNVLKLAIDLLKELENPFKISGLSANPILYNVTKLVILSALSGVLSEMLGFKLKLHKIKFK